MFISKKIFVYLIVPVFLIDFSLAHGNVEVLVNFGSDFQKAGALKIGLDVTYNLSINKDSSFGLGGRYHAFSKRKYLAETSDTEGTYTHITSKEYIGQRFAFLTNYRFDITPFFIGVFNSIDIWKPISGDVKIRHSNSISYNARKNEFLWDKLTGQIGLEAGLKIISKFLIKIEIGYDYLTFQECTIIINRGSSNANLSSKTQNKCESRFHGIYGLIGIGYLF